MSKPWGSAIHLFIMVNKVTYTERDFLVPVSLCPRTRAGAKILGQTLLSWNVPGQNQLPKNNKKQDDVLEQENDVLKQEKDILKQERKF